MKDEMLVSFIVPIYNVENYIQKCVESIVNQDYTNVEIILIDDGSNDKSGEIIDSLAKKDSRIQVVHKKNEGVSAARNQGLQIARGEYILFVDGDDYVEVDYASYMVAMIKEYRSDMIVIRDSFDINVTCQVKEDHQSLVPAEKIIEDIYLGNIFMAVWNKAYRKDFLFEHNISFNPDIWYGEGMLFNIICLQYTGQVTMGHRRVYHYTFNPASAMRRFKLENEICGIKSLEIQRQCWAKSNKSIRRAWEYHHRGCYFSIIKGLIKENIVNEHKAEYCQCLKNLRKGILLPMLLNIPMKRKISAILPSLIPIIWAKRCIRKEREICKKALISM